MEKLLSQLHNKVDALQSAKTELTSILRDYHVTELICKLDSLKSAGDLDIEDIQCSDDWKMMAFKYKGKTFTEMSLILLTPILCGLVG